MSKGVNKVIILGNVAKDPDLKTTAGGTNICTFTVATNDKYKDKSGEWKETVEFHRIKFFGRLAEVAADYLSKGRQVYIEGSLKTDKWTDKQGVERYFTDIVGHELQILGSKPSDQQDRPPQRDQPARSGPRRTNTTQTQNDPIPDDFEDSIPF